MTASSALHAADSFTRDEVAYTLFCRLLSLEIISPEELAWLLEQLVSDHHLFADIGEVGDDTVFGRSFSVLVAGHVLDVDAAHRLLDVDLVHGTIARILRYAVAERDRRGFVPGKGWAHSAARTADALGACARHPAAFEAHWQAVLVAIASVADTDEPLIYLEDERLALAERSVFQRAGWRPELWNPWIARFDRPSEWTPEVTVRHANRVHLLHAARCCLVRKVGPSLWCAPSMRGSWRFVWIEGEKGERSERHAGVPGYTRLLSSLCTRTRTTGMTRNATALPRRRTAIHIATLAQSLYQRRSGAQFATEA